MVLLVLGFFAFRNGLGFGPTGLVALSNVTLSGSFDITEQDVSLPVKHTTLRFSAPETARIITSNGEINGSGNFWVEDFAGAISWDGEQFTLEGTMAGLHGQQLDIVFLDREKTEIIVTAGSVEAATINLSRFRQHLTGNLRLENHWTVQLNKTPVQIESFEGSAVFQRVNNATTLYLTGRSEQARVEQEDILKHMI